MKTKRQYKYNKTELEHRDIIYIKLSSELTRISQSIKLNYICAKENDEVVY